MEEMGNEGTTVANESKKYHLRCLDADGEAIVWMSLKERVWEGMDFLHLVELPS
jgi:hypothetical protein